VFIFLTKEWDIKIINQSFLPKNDASYF